VQARTGLAFDPIFREHLTGEDHPEAPERLSALMDAFIASGLINLMLPLEARDATEDDLRRCHSPHYLHLARRDIQRGHSQLSTGDTAICPASWEVACRSAGAVLSAIDAVFAGRCRNAFCAVRPPGHHATREAGMGFCVFNNVAVGARYAQSRHGVGRVVIVDWDVHHGNGTQDIFYEDGSVFYFSIHQSPWYPGTGDADETGHGSGRGATLNVPLFAGAGRAEVFAAFEEQLLPAMETFRPQLVLISAGFDSRLHDPLGMLRLTDQDFADLTRQMLELADRHADGRLVSVLEGGYDLHGLASAAKAHVAELIQHRG